MPPEDVSVSGDVIEGFASSSLVALIQKAFDSDVAFEGGAIVGIRRCFCSLPAFSSIGAVEPDWARRCEK
ncbi:hypothetical protein D3C71_1809870 [compost metagenome]